tara:strand:+ start:256 stop:900 length:645 start_codon:yes stop_codon:yes gene_type:complete
MNKKEIILIGGGGHCRSCIDVIESSKAYKIVGIVEDVREKVGGDILGYPVIGCDDDLPILRKKYQYAHITVGQIKSFKARNKLFELLQSLKYDLPIIVAGSALISKYSQLGKGSIVMHNTFINANAIIGKNCIINSQALIEHDCIIGDNCHISTNVKLNGNVNIGHNCFVGSNSTVLNDINLSENITLGANSLVIKDLIVNGTYFGIPAKRIMS